jgi:hypothetical protein
LVKSGIPRSWIIIIIDNPAIIRIMRWYLYIYNYISYIYIIIYLIYIYYIYTYKGLYIKGNI